MGQKSSAKTAQVDPAAFRERQVDDNCRKHALAAVLDVRKVADLPFSRFDAHADAFDLLVGLAPGTSRTLFFIGGAEHKTNIFSYVIEKERGWSTHFIPLSKHSSRVLQTFLSAGPIDGDTEAKLQQQLSEQTRSRIDRIVVYSLNHAWAMRKFDGCWHELDSRDEPTSAPRVVLPSCFPSSCGFVVVLPPER